MKGTKLVYRCVGLVLALCAVGGGLQAAPADGVTTAQWAPVGAPGFSAGGTHYISLALDKQARPYVAYKDLASSYKVTVMRFDGGAWQPVGTPGFSGGEVDRTSLVLDRQGTPYVAYTDHLAQGDWATVLRFDGSAWRPVGMPGFSVKNAGAPSLALDGQGMPWAAYSDGGYGYKASVMRFDGSVWVPVGAPGFSAGAAGAINLALGRQGTPYVAYLDVAYGRRATVMRFDGSAWQPVGTPGIAGEQGDYISLALDEQDTPYVAFQDQAHGWGATVMRFDGSVWQPVGAPGFAGAGYISLALDGQGIPYVASMDGAADFKATVMRFNGSTWQVEGTPGFSAGAAYYTSLALDGQGIPYVAYADGGYYAADGGYKATVMRLLRPIVGVQPTALVSMHCNGTQTTRTLQICNKGNADLIWNSDEEPDLSWLSQDPPSGTAPPGKCQTVTLAFDSTGLSPGNYFGNMLIASDDPFQPAVAVSVRLIVPSDTCRTLFLPLVARTSAPQEGSCTYLNDRQASPQLACLSPQAAGWHSIAGRMQPVQEN